MKDKEKKSNVKKTNSTKKVVTTKGKNNRISTDKKNAVTNKETIKEKQTTDITEEVIKNKDKILNKKPIVILASMLCVLLCIFLCIKVFNNPSREKRLEKFGKDFYENWYYEQLSSNKDERSKLLDKFKDKGLKINIDNLSRVKTYINKNLSVKELNKKEKEHNELFESLYGKDVSEPCDKEKSMVIIYPKSPYGKTDYKIETKLVCGKANK